jgi:uncharacterized protein with HEPN domain
MLDGALEATAFSSTKHRKDLDGDRMLVLALVKDLEIVGEAAANVSRETQLRHTDIPWSDIIGMRHRLTHAYFDIDLDVVWQTIKGDLPPLIRALRNSLEGDANGVDR